MSFLVFQPRSLVVNPLANTEISYCTALLNLLDLAFRAMETTRNIAMSPELYGQRSRNWLSLCIQILFLTRNLLVSGIHATSIVHQSTSQSSRQMVPTTATDVSAALSAPQHTYFAKPIDTATRFERYALLNHLYCKIYDYNKNVKPAPDPYHTLEKFYGNLSIQEYRRHLKSERILLVVDKPLTRMLPELHEDNDEFVLNTKTTGGAGSFKLRRSRQKPTKAEMLAENFNMR